MLKNVVFDMDGVLLDTERVFIRAWKKSAAEVVPGVDMEKLEKVMRGCIGRNEADIKLFFGEQMGTEFPFEEYWSLAIKYFGEIEMSEGLPVFSGVRECLSYLNENGYNVALATSTRQATASRQLKTAGLYDYFSKFVYGDFVEHSKPQPDIYLLAAKELGVDPSECYAVEDSYNGIRSAHAAGMKPVMVPDLLPATDEMRSLYFWECKSLFEFRDKLIAINE